MPRKRQPTKSQRSSPPGEPQPLDTEIRIIGGQFRGRRLRYHGDPIVRPMKHRVREAMFNLIGPSVNGRHAIDLFAGTGALALEALSRGAVQATLIEKHVPTARIVEENIRTLGVDDRTTLLITSAFLWAKRDLLAMSEGSKVESPSVSPTFGVRPSTTDQPWLVFCSPPYVFFTERREEMLDLIARLQAHSPSESIIVVESDEHFDWQPLAGEWDIRPYPPAIVGLWHKPS